METPLLSTPLLDEHRALGARIVPFAGWQMPVQYKGILQEHEAVRTRAGLFDVSHMGELLLEGPKALEVVDGLVTNHVLSLVDGQAAYTPCCNEQGTLLDDLIVYRRSAERVLVVCNAGNLDKIRKHFETAAQGRCSFEDLSSRTALVALQGPTAMEILAAAGGASFTSLPGFHIADGLVAGITVSVARTGYTGEDGVEIFCASENAPALWRALLEAGAPFGIEPCGLGARDTLRLEAKLPLYGNDLDETTTPLEAGLDRWVKLDAHDFVGKQALVAQRTNGLTRKLVGFEMTGRGIARHGMPVVVGGEVVGVVSSGSPSPTLGKNIGLAYVPVSHASVGTPLGIDVRGKIVDAVVVKTPFYKRPR